MAVPHFSVSIVARGSGRSAVLSAAYRHCARMQFEREARTIDYTRKQGLLHEEFSIPPDAPQWLRAMLAGRSIAACSEGFWNSVEDFETRCDAQLAKDVTIALPTELSVDQNIALVRDFVRRHVTARGMVADWVFHDAPGNPHIHLMMTLRPLTEEGFGAKKVTCRHADGSAMRNDSGKIVYELWAGGADDFNAFRDGWFACQNHHLARAGLDVRIDGRSFEKQGIALTPTIHLGAGTKAIGRKSESSGQMLSLQRLKTQEERRADNRRRIEKRPETVLELVARDKSVFEERDVAKVLHRYIDDASEFRDLMARLLQSPQILRLDRERVDLATGLRLPAKYTTRALIRLESEMVSRAVWLSRRSSHAIDDAVLKATFSRHERLSDEQMAAIEHVAGAQRIAAVIGRAGAGKTTMMKAAREAFEAAGYRVVGGALAGKAAEGLEKEAGIVSRTLSSWELQWDRGRNRIDARTVFVLDEAGMVSSRQMALFVECVTRVGAKLVLVGDPEQLQPIEAGAAFRAIADRIGYAELETIYRQREQWMRCASLDLARGQVGKAIDAYRVNGRVVGADLKAQAIDALMTDWSRDYDPDRSSLILAHMRRDVRLLNELARKKLIERGILFDGHSFETADGKRRFAAGDQIVFLKNEGSLGVKNGTLAKVVDASRGRLVAQIGNGAKARCVPVEQRFYNTVDYGYATTIHKSQGATVDRVKVLASLSLDRHLAYVAMTRHREDLTLYYGERSFAKAGGLDLVLSRSNAKETTLDYTHSRFYRQALRFAEARGLHLVNVARTMAHDRLRWTLRQRSKVIELGARLAAVARRLGIGAAVSRRSTLAIVKEEKPMVSCTTTFTTSIAQMVEDRIAADPALKSAWQDISTRFHHVYADPQTAFKSVDVDAMLTDRAAAGITIEAIAARPQNFGRLKGNAGVLAGSGETRARAIALANAPALARALEAYLSKRIEAEGRYDAEEQARRDRLSLSIPALSVTAMQVLERVRDTIQRDNLSAGFEHVLADRTVKSELQDFATAVTKRFGERAFLPLAAQTADGRVFDALSAGMQEPQRNALRAAWQTIRTVQQIAAHERTAVALSRTDLLRQSQTNGIKLR